MAPYRGKRTVNSAELLIRRSRGVLDAGTLIRQNMKLLRDLILQVKEHGMHVVEAVLVCTKHLLSLLLHRRTTGTSAKYGARPQNPQ